MENDKTSEKEAIDVQNACEQEASDEKFVKDFKVKNVVFYPFFKRAFDVLASFFALLILALPLLFVCVIVRIDSKGSAFYVSERVGKNGRIFKLYKFRSMVENADEKLASLLENNEIDGNVTFKIKDDPRVTKVGRFLRKTSIDELPQLINILKGDMSFIGPRPGTPREYGLYSEKDKLRVLVPQGLSGEWQTHGRSNTTYEQMIEMDLDYIANKRGFFYDLHLIFKTIGVALRQDGAE